MFTKSNTADLVIQAFLVYKHMLRHVLGIDKSILTRKTDARKHSKKRYKKTGQHDCRMEAAVDADNRMNSYKGDKKWIDASSYKSKHLR